MMNPETPSKSKGFPGAQVAKVLELVNCQDGAVVSREVVIDSVLKLLSDKTEHGVCGHFQEALVKKKFDQHNVQAGRGFVKAYVEYTHYVKGIHDATARATHGHFPETAAQ